MSIKRTLAPWEASDTENKHVLKLYNSLTRQKEVFKPKDGNKVLWYSCGPTVYDASHMGHARSYMSFDILRRVLTDYFGYNVLYVMNITDIDDKIIKNARKAYLYDIYLDEVRTLKSTEQVLQDTHEALIHLRKKVEKANEPEVKKMLLGLAENVAAALPEVEKAVLKNDEKIMYGVFDSFLTYSKDVISDWLDAMKGHTVNNNTIFQSLPQYWEEEFHQDMEKLNILKPDVLTRVTDYVPEIIDYIKQIIKNGLAYESNGSVYFDVAGFDHTSNHYYAKLVPEAVGDINRLQDGEGELSSNKEKRATSDFALWKASKDGEPAWPSPWGNGRPGWHIECSVMASAICGNSLDIHTGGVDLKFPHHDNELAQSEAYFNQDSWVRYFLHSGHLKIEGQKMSKSLKNFITIKDALKKYTARQLRFAFLLHSWREQLDYSENTMEMAIGYEHFLNEFFLTIKDTISVLKSDEFSDNFTKFNKDDLYLNDLFLNTKASIHKALCDSVDTRTVLEKIKECITNCNIYLKRTKRNVYLIESIAVYITDILKMFGVIDSKQHIGFPLSGTIDCELEDLIMPYLRILGNFRDTVRSCAKTAKVESILKLCDELRDDILPDVGVRLEDKKDEPCAIKLADRDELLEEKRLKKELQSSNKKSKQKVQQPQPVVDPARMFLHMTDKYSVFGPEGIPTHDVEGNEITKAQQKKLVKLYQLQMKKFLKSKPADEK